VAYERVKPTRHANLTFFASFYVRSSTISLAQLYLCNYLVIATVFGGKIKCMSHRMYILNSSKTFIPRRFSIHKEFTETPKRHLRIQAECSMFLPDFNKPRITSTDFNTKVPNALHVSAKVRHFQSGYTIIFETY
jgi:hypothetical protein